jgi:5'-deoxynucleotidase
MSHFFAVVSRMKYINRWGLMRNTREENLSEHSLETAMIAHALAVIGNRRLGKEIDPERVAVLALYHDATEILTGDLPTPVKYHSPQIRSAYREVEALAEKRLAGLLPEDLREEYESLLRFSGERDQEYKIYVKAADKISAIIKCVEEKKSGNQEFASAQRSLRETVDSLGLEEAQIFLREFLPSYELNLDEQGIQN